MKPGRNDPCGCGSGKKYKHCCEGKVELRSMAPSPAEINQLIALYNAGHFAELESRAHSLVSQYPDFGFGWQLLGGALQRQGKNALSAFQKAAELLPGEVDAHSNLGYVLKELGQLDEAVACYRRVLQLKPGYKAAYSNLSQLLFEIGKFDEAVQNFHLSAPHVLLDQVLVSGILGVKEYCEKTNSPYHLIHPARNITVEMPRFIGEKFAGAEGVTQSNELYVAELSQAKVLAKNNFILLDDSIALYDNLVHPMGDTAELRFERAIQAHAHKKLMIDTSAFKTTYAKCGIHLVGASTSVFGHWMFEHLPKIKLFDTLPEYNHYPVYVDATMPRGHFQALELLTQGNRKIIPINSDASLQFEKLLVAPTFTYFPFASKLGTPANIHTGLTPLEGALFLRDKFLSILGLSADPVPEGRKGRRIFIGRKHKGRKLVNQGEIMEYLSAHNFEVVYPEDLSFAQQVKIFNESEYIVGPNGSAFSNVIFCKRGAKVVTFRQGRGANFWQQVLKELGHEHLYVAGQALPPSAGAAWHPHHLDYMVPISLVKQALEYFECT